MDIPVDRYGGVHSLLICTSITVHWGFLPATGLASRIILIVPDNKSRNIPEVVFVRRWAVGVLGIWREGVGWEGGGSRWVKVGQFITNLGLRWTFLSQLEGAK